MNARRKDKHLYAEFLDMAEQSRSNPVNDSEQLRKDLQRQEELALAQRRVNTGIRSDKESARFDDAIAAREAKEAQIEKHPMQSVMKEPLVAKLIRNDGGR